MTLYTKDKHGKFRKVRLIDFPSKPADGIWVVRANEFGGSSAKTRIFRECSFKRFNKEMLRMVAKRMEDIVKLMLMLDTLACSINDRAIAVVLLLSIKESLYHPGLSRMKVFNWVLSKSKL